MVGQARVVSGTVTRAVGKRLPIHSITLYYRRQVTPEQVKLLLQAHAEGSNFRGITRMGHHAYGTIVSVVRASSHKAQMMHNEDVRDVGCDEIDGDEM